MNWIDRTRAIQTGSPVEIRLMSASDLPSAIHLEEQARWNQTESDWRRLLALEPLGCFAACIGQRVIGTLTTVTYRTELAWIGMVLVDPCFRRRGVASRLMRTALDYLHGLGVSTVKLDATPDGRPVYEAAGFVAETLIERWEGISQRVAVENVWRMDAKARSAVYVLDRLAFGCDRAALLDSLIADSCVAPLIAGESAGGKARGYALARRGQRAYYLGPLVALDEHTAAALFDGVLSQLIGENIFIDLNTDFGIDSRFFSERGFVRQRELVRMRYGKESRMGTSTCVFAIAGPEVG